MRITDHRIVDMAAAAAQRNQSTVGELSQQVSTGLRVSKPSDDPAAWMTAQREKVRAALNDGTSQVVDAGHERLVASDGALSTLAGIISQARDLAVEGANDTLSAAARQDIATQLNSLFDTAVSTANTINADGEYLFSGENSLTQPFDTTTGAYTGDAAARAVNTGPQATQIATVPGSGLTAAGGVDILPLLKTLATAMNTNNAASIQSSLGGLVTAVNQISLLRGQTGARMAVLETAKTAHEQLATRIQTSISEGIEVDTVAAASNLAKASQALAVSQSVMTHVLQLLDPSK
jgi:flagellar hook-associated protein 3 FlgL